jgi:hypothetical protein
MGAVVRGLLPATGVHIYLVFITPWGGSLTRLATNLLGNLWKDLIVNPYH